jgi:hypothetical protein
MIFSNKGYGAFDTPKDVRDFKRGHFFGGKTGRSVIKEFDHSVLYKTKDQHDSMACGYFSGCSGLEIKFFLTTGKKLVIPDERILELWNFGTSQGFGDKKKGSYIYDVLKFFHKKERGQIFMDEDGREVKVWVEDYFDMDDEDENSFWEEVYFGGCVLTGTSSRLGLVIANAKYKPYFPKSQKRAVNDGHAFPIVGKGRSWQEFVSRQFKSFSDEGAAVHKNSWGSRWGDNGNFYTKSDQRGNLFRFWGFTIGFEYVEGNEKSEEKEKLFKDVSNDSWAFEAIKWARDEGIFKGYDDGTFRPNQPVTRAEMAVLLKRIDEKLG